MKVQHWGLAWGLAALCCAVGASAQASVLERVAGGGKLVIAYRESSVPFSYIDSQSGKPVGYAMDLCLRMAELVRKKTGKKDMEIDLVPATSANRMALIEQGKADMECGSTTNNAERRQRGPSPFPTSSLEHGSWSRPPAALTRWRTSMARSWCPPKAPRP